MLRSVKSVGLEILLVLSCFITLGITFSLRNQKCRGLLGFFLQHFALEICKILHVLRPSQTCESQTGTWPGRKVNVQIDIGKATVAVVLLQMVLYWTLHQIRKKKKLNNVNQDYAQLVPKHIYIMSRIAWHYTGRRKKDIYSWVEIVEGPNEDVKAIKLWVLVG